MWDAVNNRWNQSILNYTQGKQLNLLRNLGFESPGWEDLLYLLAGVLVLASLLGAIWTLWERSRQDPWLRLLATAATRLTKAGVSIAPNSPPRRLAEQLLAQSGRDDPCNRAIAKWLLQLEAQRYAPPPAHGGGHGARRTDMARRDRARLATLRREFNQLTWPT